MRSHHMIYQVDADARLDTVRSALTTSEGIAGWWTDRAVVPAERGGTLLLTFPLMPEPWRLELAQCDDTQIEWRVGGFPPAWAGTRVVWRLAAIPDTAGTTDAATRIVLQHRDWDEAAPTVGTVAVRWVQVLHALCAYVRTGVPDPVYVNAADGQGS